MIYSHYDEGSRQWMHYHSNTDTPRVFLPAERLAAGQTVALQEVRIQLPPDAQLMPSSPKAKGIVLTTPQVPPQGCDCAPKPRKRKSGTHWTTKLLWTLTAIRLGIFWEEHGHRIDEQRHHALLRDISRRLP